MQGDRAMRNARSGGFGALIVAALLTSSCSNPEQEKMRHVQLGDQYVAEKRDDFAVVEYASAVKIDPKFGEARFKLAEAYERLNNVRAAFAEFIRAADALPNDRKAQLKATQLLLLAGRYEDAKARAVALLAKDSKDVEAMLLHASAVASLRDASGAIAQIEEALKISPDSSRAYTSLGVVRMQSGEAREAEAAFRRAVALDPSSMDAKLALASFFMSTERMPEAEPIIKDVLVQQPQNVLANRMLSALYIATGRQKEAEQPLKALAEITKLPAARLQLADYYSSVGRNEDAKNVLKSLSAEPATFVEAETRLAALEYTEGHLTEAHKRLDAILARAPSDASALVKKAEWLTKENKLDEALKTATAAVAASPDSAAAHFALAEVHNRRREVAEAINSYKEALRLNPRAAAASVALAGLSLSAGDKTAALQYAEEARTAEPASLIPRVAVVGGLLATGDLARAETEVNLLLQTAPNAAVVHHLNGTLQTLRNNPAAARKSFERALELSPGYFSAIGGLTYLDLAAKAPAQALARLEPEIAKRPDDAPLLALAAKAHTAAGDRAKAEQALRRAVTADPRFALGYTMLAELFLAQGRMDAARAEFEGIVQRNPSSVSARTMVGVLLEAQGKLDEARKSYEATVKSTDNAPVAANNLAFMYAEQGTNLDVALQLATTAKQRLPDDPNVDDTIGWIYFKKDLPSLAVKPLEESVRRLPDRADVRLHLGLVYLKLGDKTKARSTIEQALKLDPKVGGEEARRALESASR
jgi:tetratricopeptide (TPR) repeat protein